MDFFVLEGVGNIAIPEGHAINAPPFFVPLTVDFPVNQPPPRQGKRVWAFSQGKTHNSNHNAKPQSFPLFSRFFHASFSLHAPYSFSRLKAKKERKSRHSPAHFCPELARGLRGKIGVVTQLRPLPKGLPLDSLMLGAAFLA